jgi:serine/threonine-protein kinase
LKEISLNNYGRYQIIKELGKGAMGVVYQAYDPEIDRSVALKVLREDRLTSDTFIHRFLREAKAIGRLSHPNIVTVYDVGQDRGTIYIAMEFLDGEPLHKIIERKRLPLREVLLLGIQVAETLDYAHQKGCEAE